MVMDHNIDSNFIDLEISDGMRLFSRCWPWENRYRILEAAVPNLDTEIIAGEAKTHASAPGGWGTIITDILCALTQVVVSGRNKEEKGKR
jgi:hypothetical protein